MSRLFITLLVLSGTRLGALNLADFKTCISASPGAFSSYTTCTLDTGTYNISSSSDTFVVGRTVNVQGYTSDPTQVIIRRATTAADVELMHVADYVSYVTILGFQFDSDNICPAYNSIDLNMNPDGGTTYIAAELNNFVNSGPLTSCGVVHFSVNLTNNSQLDWNKFDHGGGIWLSSVSYTTVAYNHWDSSPGSPIVLDATYQSTIEGNTIDYPYSGPFPNNTPCGSIVLENNNSYTYVQDNTFDGGSVASGNVYMVGVEGYGSYHYYYDNTISNYSGSGISEVGTDHIVFDALAGGSGNVVNGNGYGTTSFTFPGVSISDVYVNVTPPTPPPYSNTKCVSTVTANKLTAQSNSETGLTIQNFNNSNCAPGDITGVTVTYGNFCSNASGTHGVYFDSNVSTPTTTKADGTRADTQQNGNFLGS